MELIENTPERLVLRMDAKYGLANAIRRSIDEVPVLAFDEVEFFKNGSALYDEVLAHRIGLIPLKTDKKMTAKTRLDMKLVKKGPNWVYSGDFKGGVKLIHDNMPITLLDEGQEIELVATATLGKALDHAKYSAGLYYYKELVEVKSGKSEVEKIIKDSRGLIKPEKTGSKWVCDLKDAEIDTIKKLDKDAVQDSGEIIVFIESWGQMPAKDILAGAIGALEKNLAEFEKSIK